MKSARQVIVDHPHLLPRIDPFTRVSEKSIWGDAVWYLDNATAGMHKSSTGISWDFELDTGGRFTDAAHSALLDAARRLVWTLIYDNRHGRNLKPSAVTTIGMGMRYVMAWMVRHGFSDLGYLTPQVCEIIHSDLQHDVQHAKEGEKKRKVFHYTLSFLTYLFEQRDIYVEVGLPAMPAPPFGNRSIKQLNEETFPKNRMQEESEMELPREVALPILMAAQRFIGIPAKDIIHLQKIAAAVFNQSTNNPYGLKYLSTIHALQRFRFSTVPGEVNAWHAPLVARHRVSMHREVQKSRGDVYHGPGTLLTQLTKDLIGAITIVLQGGIGIRSSEVAGLRGGTDPLTGLPSCIELRSSKSGLSEIFYVQGRLYKTAATFQDTEWVCGMRPKGSTYLPPVVQALQVAEKLLSPWRARTDHPELLTFSHSGVGLPRTDRAIEPIKSAMLRIYQRSFTRHFVEIDWANLPSTPQAEPFRLLGVEALKQRQWRKTWARFLFSMDLTAAPAISQQFKHLGLAMAEEGYIGNDPGLQEVALETILENSVDIFEDIAHGYGAMTGNLAKLIQAHHDILRNLVADKPVQEGRAAVTEFVMTNDLRIWFHEHGDCGIGLMPLKAMCHIVADTVSPDATEPNWSTQQPSLCVGCACWMTSHRHASFWLNRYAHNRVAVLEHQAQLPSGEGRLFEKRALQASGILKAIGIPIPTDEVAHALQAP